MPPFSRRGQATSIVPESPAAPAGSTARRADLSQARPRRRGPASGECGWKGIFTFDL
jgi:hypothetical protein